ncbi:WcaG Nucleoside-diphosphate-sugar epimerases [Burkholderiaceae bacterium]
MKKILVTGSKGFIGKNLLAHLHDNTLAEIISFENHQDESQLRALVQQAELIIHLAASNRPKNSADFARINVGLTRLLCSAIEDSKRAIPIIFTSSTQASLPNPYGESKLVAEQVLQQFSSTHNNSLAIYRLPGVFGKWCKPNYNSVVATFCHNIAHDLPIQIHEPNKEIDLVHIDDVIRSILENIKNPFQGIIAPIINPTYQITLGKLAAIISDFNIQRAQGKVDCVGTGFLRALYSTFISYLPPEKFTNIISGSSDRRGIFVEFLKTPNCGQISYFTALPGITRGEHYHHTKTEKFLVAKGRARFQFRNLITNEICEIYTSCSHPEIVDSIPGWAHNITNIDDSELIVIVWANEIYNHQLPDTIPAKYL